MSKAALDQFTKTTAIELASQKVRCNAVNPGVTKTPSFDGCEEVIIILFNFNITKRFL